MLSDETLDPTWETIHLSYEGNGHGHSGSLVKIQAGGVRVRQCRGAQPGSSPAVAACSDLGRPASLPLCFVDTLTEPLAMIPSVRLTDGTVEMNL